MGRIGGDIQLHLALSYTTPLGFLIGQTYLVVLNLFIQLLLLVINSAVSGRICGHRAHGFVGDVEIDTTVHALVILYVTCQKCGILYNYRIRL